MKEYFLNRTRRLKYTAFLGDAIFVALSFPIAYIVNFALLTKRPDPFKLLLDRIQTRFLPLAGFLVILYIFTFYLFDLYEFDKIKRPYRNFFGISFCVLAVGILTSGFLFFFTKYFIGRRVVLITIPVMIILLNIWRALFLHLIVRRDKIRRLALIGNRDTIYRFIHEFQELNKTDIKISDVFLVSGGSEPQEGLPEEIEVADDLDILLAEPSFDTLVFENPKSEPVAKKIHQIMELKFMGISIYDFASFYEEVTGKVPLNYVDENWVLSRSEFQGKVSEFYMRIKRFIDIALAAVFIIISLPLQLLVSMAVILESRGGVFFKQERLGLMKRPFIMYKFRTMKADAEKETGPVWSNKDDPRITRVGKFLRMTRLDELPQFWNILKGDMSFVGTRPIRKHFADQFRETIPFYDFRFLVKPGLTGWAQINFGYSGSEEEQIQKFYYELFYIKNISLFLDLFIIFKTIKTVTKRTGE